MNTSTVGLFLETRVPAQGRCLSIVARKALYRGISLIRDINPLQGHHRALGIVLLQSPKGALFLMSEVSLYRPSPFRLC